MGLAGWGGCCAMTDRTLEYAALTAAAALRTAAAPSPHPPTSTTHGEAVAVRPPSYFAAKSRAIVRNHSGGQGVGRSGMRCSDTCSL